MLSLEDLSENHYVFESNHDISTKTLKPLYYECKNEDQEGVMGLTQEKAFMLFINLRSIQIALQQIMDEFNANI